MAQSLSKQNAELQKKLDEALHDAWVAQVMLSTVINSIGVVVVSKDDAALDLTNKGIDITESDDGKTLILQLKDATEEDESE